MNGLPADITPVYWGIRTRGRRMFFISEEERQALIAEAIAEGRVTVLPPGAAWGVEPMRCGAGTARARGPERMA